MAFNVVCFLLCLFTTRPLRPFLVRRLYTATLVPGFFARCQESIWLDLLLPLKEMTFKMQTAFWTFLCINLPTTCPVSSYFLMTVWMHLKRLVWWAVARSEYCRFTKLQWRMFIWQFVSYVVSPWGTLVLQLPFYISTIFSKFYPTWFGYLCVFRFNWIWSVNMLPCQKISIFCIFAKCKTYVQITYVQLLIW